MLKRLLPLVVLPALLSGCASTDPRPAFDDTAALIKGRHPGQLAFRPQGAIADAQAARVEQILAAPLSADGAAELALLRNPFLRARLEDLGIAQADLAQATRLANPGVSFELLRGNGENSRTTALAADVVDWLTLPLRKKVAAAALERTKLEVGQALLETVAAARSAFIDFQAHALLVERLEKIEAIDRAAADYAQALFTAGNLTAIERANSEAAWAETRAELVAARGALAVSREALIQVCALEPTVVWHADMLATSITWAAPDTATLETLAVEQRLDLDAAQWAIATLEAALRLKRATRLLPVGVELGVKRERETDGLKLTGPTLDVHLPIFDLGKAGVARLEAELAQARWQQIGLEARARSEVRLALGALATAAELVELHQKTLVPRRLEVLEGTLLEYNAMLVGTFDVLTAKRLEIAAEKGLVEALRAFWHGRVALETALGGSLPASASPASNHQDHQHEGT
jgi:outer membrane protein, heavy metal efflux system